MSQKPKRRSSPTKRDDEARSFRRHSDGTSLHKGDRESGTHLTRSKSFPNGMSHHGWPPIIKGIMKFRSLDESLHSTYRTVSDADENSGEGGASNVNNSPKRERSIKFTNIEVREYARTVGDNPSCSSGPPVSISWEYNPETMTLSVEEYENTRPARRTQSQMVLPRSVRMDILRKEWGISQQQIASAVRSGVRAKNQRRTTLGNLGKTDRLEEVIEGATKQLLKSLFLRRSSSERAAELEEKMRLAERQRSQWLLEHTMSGEYSDGGSSDDAAPRMPVRRGDAAAPPRPPQRRNDVIVAYEDELDLELSDETMDISERISGEYSASDLAAAAKLLVAEKQQLELTKKLQLQAAGLSLDSSSHHTKPLEPKAQQPPELTPQPPDDEDLPPPITKEPPKLSAAPAIHHHMVHDLSPETAVEC